MVKLSNARDIKENVSIVELLARLGFQPVPKHGREKMYISMLRDNDTSPSLSVNEELGLWFDHGNHKGGNIIDFGLAYWPGYTISEVINRIRQIFNEGILQAPMKPAKKMLVEPHYQIDQIKNIGSHPAISAYLKNRGVFEIAAKYLKEVYYHVIDDQNQKKKYFAAGWKNERGGWEVRNLYFKGAIGPKGLITLADDAKSCCVFEGYFDFLSWKVENPAAKQSIIILNTLALIESGITLGKNFSSIDIFFDRDKAGVEATRHFIKSLPYASDRSKLYEGFNDYNDKIKAASKSGNPLPTDQQADVSVTKTLNKR